MERGGWLLLILMLGMTVYDLGRSSFQYERSPALAVSHKMGAQILLLDNDGRLDGVHQINDATQLISVINLAGASVPPNIRRILLGESAIVDGKMLKLQIVDNVVRSAGFCWMPAAMRMSLGIPLRIDRMSAADWEDLPGVGPSLALRIEENRQNNGEFGSLEELQGVHGIGTKSVQRWSVFFEEANLLENRQKI